MGLTTLQARLANFDITGETVHIFDVLGTGRDSDPIKPGDGFPWFNCPFCGNGVYVNGHGPDVPEHATISINCECVNPWCLANPNMPKAEAERIYREARKKAEGEAERKRYHDLAMKRIADSRARHEAERARIVEECTAGGFCVRCALAAYNASRKPKRIRHRAECPESRR